MPITVYCPCDNLYRVKDELAGKLIKCPYCQQPVTVPLRDVESPQRFESLESGNPASFSDSSPGNPYPHQSYQPPPSFPAPQSTVPGATELETISQIGQASESSPRTRSSGVNGGKVLLGLVMMVGAAAWFFYTLSLNKRFPRGAVFLFVFGLISFIKGLSGSSE